jgi:hypothetical protein
MPLRLIAVEQAVALVAVPLSSRHRVVSSTSPAEVAFYPRRASPARTAVSLRLAKLLRDDRRDIATAQLSGDAVRSPLEMIADSHVGLNVGLVSERV